MMKKYLQLVVLLIFILAGTAIYFFLPHKTWINNSNRIALKFITSVGAIEPEQASAMGLSVYNKKTFRIKKDTDEQFLMLYKSWDKRINRKLAKVKNDNFKIDLKILQDYVRNRIRTLELARKYKIMPPIVGASYIFNNINILMNNQSSEKDRADAVTRFKEYVAPEEGVPFLTAHQNYLIGKILSYKSRRIIYPSYEQVKEYLDNSKIYVAGIKSLLETSSRKDWMEDFNEFKHQIETYDKYIAKNILPRASCIPNLPEPVYIQRLKEYGVTTKIDQLIENGKSAYTKEYKTFLEMAQKLARKYNLLDAHPRSVIAYLKTKKVSKIDDLQSLYINAASRLQRIIVDKKLVTLPVNALRVRIASVAESKTIPAPNLYLPAYLQGNTMLPEFVVPVSGEKLLYDDFAYPAIAFGLTAHEGRPGHDLHIRRTYEQDKSSIIRATFAKNSVNHEGWALYAESLVFPYGTLEEQFTMQQMKLLRIARYYLDPMIQLGEVDQEAIVSTLYNDLGISPEFASVEYKRYAYLYPGQATAYYQGFLNIEAFYKKLEETHGKLNLKCFNDTLLSFGFMPHYYITEFQDKFAVCIQN